MSTLFKSSSLLSQNYGVILRNKNFNIRLMSSQGLASKERKRFYKNVGICESTNKMFEINLDKRKLKTPLGKLFQVDNELLAQMIAQEWQSQLSVIKLTTMHLSSLTNTFLDNPNKVSKESISKSLNEYLKTDTILYFDDSNKNLFNMQCEKWKPLVDWFNIKFNDLNLNIKQDLNMNENGIEIQNSFLKYLNENFDLNTLIALNYMCECLKSVIISIALLERFIPTVDEACRLANLEQIFQNEKWGKVEWYHDINDQEVRSRVSAALCLIYLSNKSKYLCVKNSKPSN